MREGQALEKGWDDGVEVDGSGAGAEVDVTQRLACMLVKARVEAACKPLVRLVGHSGVGSVLEASTAVDSRLAEATVESAEDSLDRETTAILVSIPVEVAAVPAVGVGT